MKKKIVIEMVYKRENLIEGLIIAIELRQQDEANLFPKGGESALLAGSKTLLKDLIEGKPVEIELGNIG